MYSKGVCRIGTKIDVMGEIFIVFRRIRQVEHEKESYIKELIFVASMLFGMFFGAGNLIFPIFMGQLAGHHVWAASAGF